MSFYDEHKQVVDQSAHFVVGFLVVVVLGLAMPWLAAFVVMVIAAVIREAWQHGGLDFGSGTALDLEFFALGGAVAVLFS